MASKELKKLGVKQKERDGGRGGRDKDKEERKERKAVKKGKGKDGQCRPIPDYLI